MTAQELRIGNWVMLDNLGTATQIDAGDLLAMTQCEMVGQKADFIKPISLSVGILERAGFVLIEDSHHKFPRVFETYNKGKMVERIDRTYALPSEDDGYVSYDRFKVMVIIDPPTGNIRSIRLSENTIPELQYVHNLQNLFYALEGEELEIKP